MFEHISDKEPSVHNSRLVIAETRVKNKSGTCGSADETFSQVSRLLKRVVDRLCTSYTFSNRPIKYQLVR